MTTEKQKIRAKASRRGRTTSPGKTTRSAEITPSEKKKYSPSKNISPKSSKSPPSSNSTKNSENRSPKRPSPPPEQDEGPVEPEQKRHKSKKPAPLPASPTAPSPTLPRQASLEPKEKGIEAIQRELDDVSLPQLSWPFLDRSFPGGMRNPGQWCYRRAMLQALVHIPPLLNFLWEKCEFCTHQRNMPCNVCRLARLTKGLWSRNSVRAQQALANFDYYIRSCAPEAEDPEAAYATKGGRVRGLWDPDNEWIVSRAHEADAHEFLTFVISGMLAENSGYKTDIQALFYVLAPHHWTCSDCRYTHLSPDPPQLCLHVPIEDDLGENMYEYLDEVFKREQVRSSCERDICAQKDVQKEAHRQSKFLRMPPVLFIQLQRLTLFGQKIEKHIGYPIHLDLAQYASDKLVKGTGKYQLSSVVAHRGEGLDRGHYICIAQVTDGSFALYDDSEVEEVGVEELLKPSEGFNPYILTYIQEETSETTG